MQNFGHPHKQNELIFQNKQSYFEKPTNNKLKNGDIDDNTNEIP